MSQNLNRSVPLKRRDFLRGLGAAGAFTGAAMLAGCKAAIVRSSAPASDALGADTAVLPTATPAAAAAFTPETAAATATGRARVALVKTGSRADGVRQALALFGVPDTGGKHIFLKPNFNSADPAPGSTHPDVLRTVIGALQQGKPSRIVVGDRSGMGNTRQVLEQAGVFSLAQELGFEALVLDELDVNGWQHFNPPGSHWARGFALPKPLLEADMVVQTCCLKTHRFGGHFTLSLKNSVGLAAKTLPDEDYNYMGELHSSPDQRRMIAEINTVYAPSLIVLDGVEAFRTGGPDSGDKVAANVVLAGSDRVAVDAVGVAILRLLGTTPAVSEEPIFSQEQLARAVELGLGAASGAQIELITSDEEGAAYAAQIEQMLLA
ncbi:MAG: DUF362 domain-containing protein [Caldilineaceae bacterium]